ncbi:MAG TPA: DegV family protein [Candidatus Limnocylindrales bacterium]|nr:DegV family protein [Candidatus Limnocylindrales bacterium]
MSRVAIVTDSASDLPAERAAAAGVTVVPLLAYFGDREYRAGVDLSYEEFWRLLTAPGAPFPKTAAAAPGSFKEAFEELFARGFDEIVCINVGAKLSATVGSAKVAREMMPERAIHVVDSESASMGLGLLALLAAQRAREGKSGAEIVAELERRKGSLSLFLAIDTLEYLKRGGRISPARAAIGSVLSVKPIISVIDGVVEIVDKPRTRGKARARVLELLSAADPEMVAVLHGQTEDIESFAAELARTIRFPREMMTIDLIGPSIGPHVGPGVYGAVILPKA